MPSWGRRQDLVAEIEAHLHDRAEKEISSEELEFVDEVKGRQREDKAKPAVAARPKVLARTK